MTFSWIRFRWNLQQMRSQGNPWVRSIAYAIAFTLDGINLDPLLFEELERELNGD